MIWMSVVWFTKVCATNVNINSNPQKDLLLKYWNSMNKQEKFAKKLLEFNLGGPICRNYPVCTEPSEVPWRNSFCCKCLDRYFEDPDHMEEEVTKYLNSPAGAKVKENIDKLIWVLYNDQKRKIR
jgi:hypothetical protein